MGSNHDHNSSNLIFLDDHRHNSEVSDPRKGLVRGFMFGLFIIIPIYTIILIALYLLLFK